MRRFLVESGHHLLVAVERHHALGFVSGVEMTDPDMGTEMLLDELSVEESSRRRGVGRALVGRREDLARERGGYGP